MAPKEKEIKSAVENLNYDETNLKNDEELEKLIAPQAGPWKHEWRIINSLIILYIHLAGFYGIYLAFYAKWTSLLFIRVGVVGNSLINIKILVTMYWIAGTIGITAGVHRLWAHRAYKANLPMQILLLLLYSSNLMPAALRWTNIHRRHHKFSDTDGDPHNATRGLFFSHVGWLLVRSHPESVKRNNCIDNSDLRSNPVLMVQEKYVEIFNAMMGVVVPMVVLVLYCGENWNMAWHINMMRVMTVWNCAFAINSITHRFGAKPYDTNIVATQNTPFTIITLGEAYHNYHHTFPWDYKAAELGNNRLNLSTLFIDFFAMIGWAYDLKTVDPGIIAKRAKRTGDGTNCWGY